MSYTEPQKLEIYNKSQQSNITVHLFTTSTQLMPHTWGHNIC